MYLKGTMFVPPSTSELATERSRFAVTEEPFNQSSTASEPSRPAVLLSPEAPSRSSRFLYLALQVFYPRCKFLSTIIGTLAAGAPSASCLLRTKTHTTIDIEASGPRPPDHKAC
ncbi:hypothetical protein VTO73DRAFT_2475 [Trametes versicolor]